MYLVVRVKNEKASVTEKLYLDQNTSVLAIARSLHQLFDLKKIHSINFRITFCITNRLTYKLRKKSEFSEFFIITSHLRYDSIKII